MVGSEAVNNTLTWSDIARNLPEWGSKYNITFTHSEINYKDNLVTDLKCLIKRSQNQKINQNLYKDLFN